MKRSLALACAAVALTGGSAFAQSKFDVTIGGDVFFQYGFVDQNQDAGLRSTEMRNRFRFVLTPSAKADNGLEYGARLRVRADTSNAGAGNNSTNVNRLLNQDRAFIFAKGGFGTVQAGTINGLSDEYGFIGPNVEGISGSADNTDVDFLAGSPLYESAPGEADRVLARSTNFRNLASGNAATRIVYLTPTIAGFQGGVSYMPRSDDSQNSIRRTKFDGAFEDVVEVGGIYLREIGPVALEASAYYEFGDTQRTSDTGPELKNLSSYNIAANVGFADFKVGAMYRNAGESGYVKGAIGDAADQETWIVGANYTLGPVIFAANYQYYKDAGDPIVAGNSKVDLYQAGITYTVAPGLTTGLEYSYFKARENEVALRDKGSIILLDTRVAF
ncbi:MAG TPA: porin [Azospirillum sp.]|nr:porin [Azospirillum sp.]